MEPYLQLCLLLVIGGCIQFAWAKPEQTYQTIENNSGIAVNAIGNVNLTIYQSADYKELKQAADNARINFDEYPSNSRFVKELQQAEKNLADFERNILKLAEEINKIPLNSERGKIASKYFEKGDYQAAREILKAKEMEKEKLALLKKNEQVKKQLDDLSADYILKARLTALDYKLGEQRIPQTRQYFEEALELDRTPERLFEYALFLQVQNQFHDSERLYREMLKTYQELAKVDSKVYHPYVARILNNLGVLAQADKGRRNEAEKLYVEALKIRRELAKANAPVYRPYVAKTLNNLGNLIQEDSSRRDEAEKLYLKALKIRRELAKVKPAEYRPDIAMILNNLGNLIQEDSSRRNEAEKLYNEALKIYRELAGASPIVYRADVATTLNNLGNLVQADRNRRNEAEKLYKEALTTRRELAKENPTVYRADVATTLNNLGNLVQADRSRRNEAEKLYKEALTTRRVLAGADPAIYQPDLANTLWAFGSAYVQWQQPKEALPFLQESTKLFIVLNQKAPEIFGEKLKLIKQLLNSVISEGVKKIVAKELGVNLVEVKNQSSFVNDLGADSLDTVPLIMEIEEKFGIEISDQTTSKINSVEDAIQYIENQLLKTIENDMK
ncbi:MAG: acyl carrier protein [Gammaproteobacteria bacterium]|nr:acyl carrier protein [Gammaproteobacteria bacterium]